jgi:hypothetical protein
MKLSRIHLGVDRGIKDSYTVGLVFLGPRGGFSQTFDEGQSVGSVIDGLLELSRRLESQVDTPPPLDEKQATTDNVSSFSAGQARGRLLDAASASPGAFVSVWALDLSSFVAQHDVIKGRLDALTAQCDDPSAGGQARDRLRRAAQGSQSMIYPGSALVSQDDLQTMLSGYDALVNEALARKLQDERDRLMQMRILDAHEHGGVATETPDASAGCSGVPIDYWPTMAVLRPMQEKTSLAAEAEKEIADAPLTDIGEGKAILDELDEMFDSPPDKAWIRVPRGTSGWDTQDPKYDICSVSDPSFPHEQPTMKLCNAQTGTPIPDDEPVFILRAKDRHAVAVLQGYHALCSPGAHAAAVYDRMEQFNEFALVHPERMKEPDTGPKTSTPIPKHELPRYKSHKVVRGFKIVAIQEFNDNAVLSGEVDGRRVCVTVCLDYMNKHKPQLHGYYVLYDGGYESWCPGKEFEDGNQPLDAAGDPVNERASSAWSKDLLIGDKAWRDAGFWGAAAFQPDHWASTKAFRRAVVNLPFALGPRQHVDNMDFAAELHKESATDAGKAAPEPERWVDVQDSQGIRWGRGVFEKHLDGGRALVTLASWDFSEAEKRRITNNRRMIVKLTDLTFIEPPSGDEFVDLGGEVGSSGSGSFADTRITLYPPDLQSSVSVRWAVGFVGWSFCVDGEFGYFAAGGPHGLGDPKHWHPQTIAELTARVREKIFADETMVQSMSPNNRVHMAKAWLKGGENTFLVEAKRFVNGFRG